MSNLGWVNGSFNTTVARTGILQDFGAACFAMFWGRIAMVTKKNASGITDHGTGIVGRLEQTDDGGWWTLAGIVAVFVVAVCTAIEMEVKESEKAKERKAIIEAVMQSLNDNCSPR